MPSARISYNPDTLLGRKCRSVVRKIQEARMEIQELHRLLEKYLDDDAGISGDSGLALASVPLVRNLVNQAQAEMAGLVIVPLAVDDATATRQITDAMGV